MKQFHSAVQLGECCEVVVSRCLLSCCSAVVQHVLHCFAERTSLSDTALSGRPVCLSLSRHGRLFLIVRQMCLSLNRHVRLSLIVRQTCLSVSHQTCSSVSCLALSRRCLSLFLCQVDMSVYLSLDIFVCLSLPLSRDVCLSLTVRETCLSITISHYLYLSLDMFCLSLSGRRVCRSVDMFSLTVRQTCLTCSSVYHCQVDVSVCLSLDMFICLSCLALSRHVCLSLSLSGRCVCLSLSRHVCLSVTRHVRLFLTVRQTSLSLSLDMSVSHRQVDMFVWLSLDMFVCFSLSGLSGRHVCLSVIRHVRLSLTVRQTCVCLSRDMFVYLLMSGRHVCLSVAMSICLSLSGRCVCLSFSGHVHWSLTVWQTCLSLTVSVWQI